MILTTPLYCLDANVLIQAWRGYYSPDLCKGYWSVMNDLGKRGLIFLPREAANEILRTEDELAAWLKTTEIKIREVTEEVIASVKNIFAADPKHELLVDNKNNRSLADPWVIAHAICEKATVVTKENKITNPTAKNVKIPNVCEAMGVEWINDFDFIKRMNITFECRCS